MTLIELNSTSVLKTIIFHPSRIKKVKTSRFILKGDVVDKTHDQPRVVEKSMAASAGFAQAGQRLTEELSLKEISQIFIKNWALFFILMIITSTAAIGIYLFKIPFVSSGSVVVNDSQNSSLQSFSNQFFGLTKSVVDGKKSNSPLQKHLEYLKTTEFLEQLLVQIEEKGQSSQLSLPEKNGYQIFKNNYMKSNNDSKNNDLNKLSALRSLDAMMKVKLDSDFEMKISYFTDSKDLALFLSSTTVESVVNLLKKRELEELNKVEVFIREQRELAEKNMNDFNKKLAEFQNKPENLISLSSKDKVGEYISELMVRKNEVRMKMSENNKMIDYLSQGNSGRRESQLYGNGGRVQTLKLENNMLQAKLSDIQTAIDRVTAQAKSIPYAAQMFEDLRKKSEIEFGKYKELSDAMAKAEAQKLSIDSRFEVLEKPRVDKVAPQVSLSVMLLLALVIAQIIGCVMIYVNYIWDSNTVTAESSRNVVIIDGHSIDPRVIIENSKIKFRLNNSDFNQDEDQYSSQLRFNPFGNKSSNGDDDGIY